MSPTLHLKALVSEILVFQSKASSASSRSTDSLHGESYIHRNLHAIRLGFNSDMQHIGTFISNSLNRQAEPSVRTDSNLESASQSAHHLNWPKFDTLSNLSNNMQTEIPMSPSNVGQTNDHAMPRTAKWTPHSPRSILQAMVPDSTLQRESLEMLLLQSSPSMIDVKASSWKGCSVRTRPAVWRMLFDCEPLAYADRASRLSERRKEYVKLQRIMGGPAVGSVHLDSEDRSDLNAAMLRQIDMDLPRTHPNHPVFHCPRVRSAMRRVLYLFAALHPDTGYVQGQNEVLTPLLVVFMSEHVPSGHSARTVEGFVDLESLDGVLCEEQVADAEADAYWCFAQLVSGIVDNYTVNQPGMHLRISQLEKILGKVDPPLASHMEAEGCQALQFSFRWIAALMLREFSLPLVVRLWDALLAQQDGFGEFIVYLSGALIVNWRDELLQMEFTQMITLLLNLPTGGWGPRDIDILVSQALMWSNTYKLDE